MMKTKNNHATTYSMYFSILFSLAIFIGLAFPANSQSPKKYLKNGFYEQALVNAVAKQNKKVKLKKKFTEVIYASYKDIYAKHTASIISPDTDWAHSYSRLIRMVKFRSKVTHPGVYDNLKNMLYDNPVLEHLATKFNKENLADTKVAQSYESVGEYIKALDIYHKMAVRHEQAEPISTLKDQLLIIDCEAKKEHANQKIGDQYIVEARETLENPSKQNATAAIELIQKARSHRPLDLEEEELLKLANLIIGESWIEEAKKLVETRTKKNARLAFELINRARAVRTLSEEEELLLERAENIGMTKVLLKVKGKDPIHTVQSLSGILNREKSTPWITYYTSLNNGELVDFEMEITEKQPSVKLGDVRRQVKQNTKTIEYWENETDDAGNTVKVKKTRVAVAIVAIVSRTNTAKLNWAVILKDPADGKSVHAETRESRIEITNEYVSLESGDILALPENIESDIELDSQPFPSDEEMLNRVNKLYLKELKILLQTRKDHMRNINVIIPE